jgi:multidrug efflux pump subunit AcrA (membrane-fusion protein)
LVTRVKLTAYKARSHITLQGVVVGVSGTTFKDESTHGHPYYKVRIEILPDELKKIEKGSLTTGMTAKIDIVTGKRSAIQYLLDPILDSFR